jgi:predicted O-methyltransferase YrrM
MRRARWLKVSDLAIIVPTRGRPDNIRKVISAWDFTNAWDHADLVLVVDADDPEVEGYRKLVREYSGESLVLAGQLKSIEIPKWLPMVHKLNLAAGNLALGGYFAVGFAGDDHLPQTIGWAASYLAALRELGTGMVYGDDGYQGIKLSTEWAVTSDVVRALGRMVPAPVEHMYCDNSMMDLFGAAGALRHLPEIRIEHMHPVAGKAETDAQYQRVNHRDQFRKDKTAYDRWRNLARAQDVGIVRDLRKGRPEVRPAEPTTSRMSPGSAPRRVDLRPKGKPVGRNSPFPRHFKTVTGATPEPIGIALADFASAVPADQEIVELGVFHGKTALQMAYGARQGAGAHVTAIDAWDLPGNTYGPPFNQAGTRHSARYNVQALGYNNAITLVQGFASDVATDWGIRKRVGLLFVDDDHSYGGARQAIECWAPHLADGARIAVDDYGHPDWPGVAEAVDALVAEGFLEPVEIYHDRLAVTRLAEAAGERSQRGQSTPVAITSEGVSPSPYPAVGDQVAVTVDLGGPSVIVPDGPVATDPGCMHPDCVLTHPHTGPAELVERDTAPSTEEWAWKVTPHEAVALTMPVGPVADLNLVNLKALAKHRGIVLGIRKDKRDLILQALRDGK